MSNGLVDLYRNPHSVLELEQSKSFDWRHHTRNPNQPNQPTWANQPNYLVGPFAQWRGENEKVKETYIKEERDKKQTQKSCGSDLTKETYSTLIAHDHALLSAQRSSKQQNKKKKEEEKPSQERGTNCKHKPPKSHPPLTRPSLLEQWRSSISALTTPVIHPSSKHHTSSRNPTQGPLNRIDWTDWTRTKSSWIPESLGTHQFQSAGCNFPLVRSASCGFWPILNVYLRMPAESRAAGIWRSWGGGWLCACACACACFMAFL